MSSLQQRTPGRNRPASLSTPTSKAGIICFISALAAAHTEHRSIAFAAGVNAAGCLTKSQNFSLTWSSASADRSRLFVCACRRHYTPSTVARRQPFRTSVRKNRRTMPAHHEGLTINNLAKIQTHDGWGDASAENAERVVKGTLLKFATGTGRRARRAPRSRKALRLSPLALQLVG